MRVRFGRSASGLAMVAVLTGCASTHGGTFHPSGGSSTGQTAQGNPADSAGAGGSSPAATAPSAMTTAQFTTSILDAYRSYQAAYERAYETNDTAPLEQFATDPILSRDIKDIQANASKRVFWRFHNVLNPQIQGWARDRSLAVVLDCVQNLGSYEYSLTDGARVTSKSAVNNYYQVHMKYTQGIWKAADVKVGSSC